MNIGRHIGLDTYWMRDRLAVLRRDRGLAGSLRAGAAWMAERARLVLAAEILRRTRGGCFRYADQDLPYLYHPYNATWRNERAIEVPIALAELGRAKGARVLEVGNVLSHYAAVAHDIVDLYESAGDRVRNVDIADFRPDRPYDLVLCISTIEHVGRDEKESAPEKSLRALANLRNHCLSPKGRLLLTFPLGYNSAIDRAIARDEIPFDRRTLYRRSGPGNRWREVPWGESSCAKYDFERPGADWVAVVTIAG